MAAADVLVASPVTGTGGILTAATGTTLPTAYDSALTGFTATGFIGDGGVELTIDRQTQDVFAWGGTRVRVIQTEYSCELSFEFLETTPATLALLFGADNVSTVGTDTTVKMNADTLPHFALVTKAKDGDKGVLITAADAQIVSQDPVTFSHSDAVRFPVTIACFPDANGDSATLVYDSDTTD